jgi:N utilization substance protein B
MSTSAALPRLSLTVNRGSQRLAARLAAAQVLYEMEMAGAAADAVLADHHAERWPLAEDDEMLKDKGDSVAPDRAHLGFVVRGAMERQADIDRMIDSALNKGWTMERIEALMRAILRCGTYELLAMGEVPPKVVINEYVEVAKAFYAGTEPSLVNGILDRLAHILRAEAFAPLLDTDTEQVEAGGNGDNRKQ